MLSYVAVNIVFVCLSLAILYLTKPHLNRRALAVSGGVLFVCMIIFDTYLTALPIVRYNSERILGLHLGTIPIEDFAYLAVALVLAPSVFHFIKHRLDKS